MPRRKVKLLGRDFEVLDREVDETDLVACARVADITDSPFTDNERGVCILCSAPVVFRPYMRRGQKVCLTCAPILAATRH